MIIQITETMSIEMRHGEDGFHVESVVQTNFGSKPAINHMYWTKDEKAAIAFMHGVAATNAIFNGSMKGK